MADMQLFTSPASPYARKVRIVAHERRLRERIEEIDVNPFTDPAELAAVNPLGKVPVLRTGEGVVLFDSSVICAYLDAHPRAEGTPLIPASGNERWAVLRGEAFFDGLMDLALGLILEKRKPETERSPTTEARWRRQLAHALDLAFAELDAQPAAMTLAHAAGIAALGYLDFRHPDIDWRGDRPQLAEWFRSLASRHSVMATAPA